MSNYRKSRLTQWNGKLPKDFQIRHMENWRNVFPSSAPRLFTSRIQRICTKYSPIARIGFSPSSSHQALQKQWQLHTAWRTLIWWIVMRHSATLSMPALSPHTHAAIFGEMPWSLWVHEHSTATLVQIEKLFTHFVLFIFSTFFTDSVVFLDHKESGAEESSFPETVIGQGDAYGEFKNELSHGEHITGWACLAAKVIFVLCKIE